MAALPASPPPTTIHALPIELIHRIIYLATPIVQKRTFIGRDQRSSILYRSRYRFLLSACLVHSSWTPFAQEELWRDVFVGTMDLDGFESAGPGKWVVKRLHLQVARDWEDPSARMGKVLDACNGLEDLFLEGGSINVDSLMRTGMSGLKSLDLQFESYHSRFEGRCDFPFALENLTLKTRRLPPRALLAGLCQPTITTLNLLSHDTSTSYAPFESPQTQLLEAFTPVAPQLTKLCFAADNPRDDTLSSLLTFLSGCTNLTHVETLSYDLPLSLTAEAIPVPIVSWTILEDASDRGIDELLALAGSKTHASISQLQTLRLIRGRASLKEREDWRMIVGMFTRRGVVIEL